MASEWSYIRNGDGFSLHADYRPKSFDDVLNVLIVPNSRVVLCVDSSVGSSMRYAQLREVFQQMDTLSDQQFSQRLDAITYGTTIEDEEGLKEAIRAQIDYQYAAMSMVDANTPHSAMNSGIGPDMYSVFISREEDGTEEG